MSSQETTTIRIPATRTLSVLQMSGATLTVGSLIMTAKGLRPVEDIKPGDLIVTKDFGLQKLRYIAFQDVDLVGSKELSPIKVDGRHLGFDRPCYFAPDQNLTLKHPMFDMMFGASEVLVRCGDLSESPGFETVETLSSVTYVALGFARRHIISCNGSAVEVGPSQSKPSRFVLGPQEARLASQLLSPKPDQAKRHSFPLH